MLRVFWYLAQLVPTTLMIAAARGLIFRGARWAEPRPSAAAITHGRGFTGHASRSIQEMSPTTGRQPNIKSRSNARIRALPHEIRDAINGKGHYPD